MQATTSALPRPTGSTSSLPSQADIAYVALRDMLVTLAIAPGEPLSEQELTAMIGVGRTPLREAVSRLVDERLVQKYPRRGTFAAEINLADLPLLTDLRVELEGLAAATAAQRATDHDRVRLRSLAPKPPTLGDPGTGSDGEHATGAAGQMELDVAIHRAIYVASHNPFLEETATRYHNLSTRLWYVFMSRLTSLHSHVEEHHALIDHIVEGRPREARDVATYHVRNFATAVRDLL